MLACDVFILLDDAQFSKNSFTNRVRVSGGRWLTIPVKHSFGQSIQEVSISDPKYRSSHAGRLKSLYPRNSPTLKAVVDLIESLPADRLVDANIATIQWLAVQLGVARTLIRSSTLDVGGTASTRLARLVRKVGGNEYIAGAGGRNYHDAEIFREFGVAVSTRAYQPVPYSRGSVGFEPGLSAIDALIYCGSDVRRVFTP